MRALNNLIAILEKILRTLTYWEIDYFLAEKKPKKNFNYPRNSKYGEEVQNKLNAYQRNNFPAFS